MIERSKTSRSQSTTRALVLIAFVAALAIFAAGCGGDDSDSSSSDTTTASGEPCDASIGVLTVLTGAAGPQGREMLHWAQLAVDQYNEENGTDIKVVEGDDQLDPAQAATIAQQWVSDDKIVAVVGPESDSTVESAGPIFGQPGMAMVSSTATSSRLTEGKYPTFYRVTPPDSLQGSQDAQYMIDNLDAKKVFVIDDQSAYSKGIADVVVPLLEDDGVDVSRESVSQTNTDYSALVSKIADDTDVVFLPWMLAANAQLFGDQMAEQSKTATIFGTDGVFSPQDFKVEGSYLSSFSPDVQNNPDYADLVQQFEDKYGQFGAFGLTTYPATQVVLDAVKQACADGGGTADRAAVAEAVKNTDISDSILGPISFEDSGEMTDAKFFVYTIKDGNYTLADE